MSSSATETPAVESAALDPAASAERAAAPVPEPAMATENAAVPVVGGAIADPALADPTRPLVSAAAVPQQAPAMAGAAPTGAGGPAQWPAAWPGAWQPRTAAVPPSAQPWPFRAAPQRIPSRSERVPAPNGLLAATAAAGCAAAVLVPLDRPGIGWLLAGIAITGTVYAVDRAARNAARNAEDDSDRSDVDRVDEGPQTRLSGAGEPGDARDDVASDRAARADQAAAETPSSANTGPVTGIGGLLPAGLGDVPWGRVWWTGVALALLSVGAFRAAPWLFVLCLAGAAVAGSLAVVPRSAYGAWFDVLAVPFAGLNSWPWLYRAMTRTRERVGTGTARVWWSIGAAAALLLIMVPLLAGADAVFAGLVDGLIPAVDVPAVMRWGAVFLVAGSGVAGALYLLAGPPPAAVDDDSHSGQGRGVRRFSPLEWGIPVGALTIVFAAFVATQVAVLFGGDGYVQRTASLTYAEYARSGFWQLLVVSLLTLAVIGVVLRFAAQDDVTERRWLRIAIAVVIGLALVIVASAMHRMWTYQQAYGFTLLRLLVQVFEGWIALVYLMLLASLVRLRRYWVPRVAVGAALTTLLALSVLNPEGFVADRNIARWQSGKPLDTYYLSDLSPDVLPATDRLPEPQRSAIANAVRERLKDDSWQGWNFSRATATR
ncbi:DUF4153 domain-containing protein [Nocardia sp. CA-136227]|uniref:DUF4153 domain-containing protein n=1 Tax=Nocardia sp. CA-136227 TaxID=3239979 RepID=UPI003D96672D